jgi:homoserine kinase
MDSASPSSPSSPPSSGAAVLEPLEPLQLDDRSPGRVSSSGRPLKAKALRAFAPASIGNFAAGFDSLGAALEPLSGEPWGDVVAVAPASRISLTVSGPYAHQLPADPERNLVLLAYGLYSEALAARGLEAPPLAFHLEKNLPICSGLGSSASSVAATLAAAQAAFGEPLSRLEIYEVAGRAEALVSGSVHLDNVVPSLSGGLQLMMPGVESAHDPRALPWFRELVIVVVSPDLSLATSASRQVLPKEIPLAAALAFAQNLAAFVYALEARDREVFRRCLRDLLAEPHRAHLVVRQRLAHHLPRCVVEG